MLLYFCMGKYIKLMNMRTRMDSAYWTLLFANIFWGKEKWNSFKMSDNKNNSTIFIAFKTFLAVTTVI